MSRMYDDNSGLLSYSIGFQSGFLFQSGNIFAVCDEHCVVFCLSEKQKSVSGAFDWHIYRVGRHLCYSDDDHFSKLSDALCRRECHHDSLALFRSCEMSAEEHFFFWRGYGMIMK